MQVRWRKTGERTTYGSAASSYSTTTTTTTTMASNSGTLKVEATTDDDIPICRELTKRRRRQVTLLFARVSAEFWLTGMG